MSLPPVWLGAGILAAIITAFICGFALHEQLTDLKPASLYALLMYVLSVFSNIFENWGSLTFIIFFPAFEFLRIALRLVLIIQLSALLFRTTSSMEIREGLGFIEQFVRRMFRISSRFRFTESHSLFLCFIPEIFETWFNINLAWKARGGKNGLKKISTLVFILITLSFEKAAVKAKAMDARKGWKPAGNNV